MAGPRREETIGFATTEIGSGERSPAAQSIRDVAPSPTSFEPGAVLADRYRILRFLARGGMGEVYEAEDLTLQMRVALKSIAPELAGDPRTLERVKREVLLARKVTHANVCRLHDLGLYAGLHGTTAFLTMDLLRGETLDAHLARHGRMAPVEALPLVQQMTSALDAAHAAGVIHRDFKSRNVMLVRDDDAGPSRAVVMDFGIAIASGPEERGALDSGEGRFAGTPAYMAPEQIRGAPITPATDVYALGVVMFEMVTGKLPFESTRALDVIARRLTEPAPSPRSLVPALDPVWSDVIQRCLAREPGDRFASAGGVVAALGARRARWPRAAIVAVAIACTAAVGGLAWRAARAPVADVAGAARAPVGVETVTMRRSFAVVGLRDLDARTDGGAWRATALGELLGAELAAGDRLRAASSDRVARARIELGLTGDAPLAEAAIGRLGADLDVDRIVTGTVRTTDEGGARAVAIEVLLYDAHGALLATLRDAGAESDVFALVARVATALRARLDVAEPSSAERAGVSTAIPASEGAARLYAQALGEVRALHDARAVALFAEVERIEPTFALAYAHDADALLRIGRADDATARARRAIELAGDRPRAERLWIEATALGAAKEIEKAAAKYRELFTLFPDNVEYAVALLKTTSLGNHPKDTLAEVTRLRALPPSISQDPRVDYEEARAAHMTSDYPRCLRAAEAARKRAEQRGMRILYGYAGYFEGIARDELGHPDEGIAVLEDSERLLRSLGDGYMANVIAGSLANHYVDRAELERARVTIEQTRADFAALGNTYWATSASQQLAQLDAAQGRVEVGRRGIEQALAYYRQTKELHALSGGLPVLATLVASQGDPRAAEALATEGLGVARAIGRKTKEALANLALAYVARVKGDAEGEARFEAEARAVYGAAHAEWGEADVRAMVGERAWLAGDLVMARHEVEAALHAKDGLALRFDAAEVRLVLARVALDDGHAAEAETLARDALAVFVGAHAEARRAMALAVLARARAAAGARAESERLAGEAAAITTDDVAARLRVRLDLARARRVFDAAAARGDLASIARDARLVSHADVVAEVTRVSAAAPPR